MAITATLAGGAVQLTGNPIRVTVAGASVPSGATNYHLLLKITSEDGKLHKAPYYDAKRPDEYGEALFEIQGYLDQPVKKSFQFPIAATVATYPAQTFSVKVQPGERYIDESGDEKENWGTASSSFRVLKGGFNPRQIAAMKLDSSTFYTKYISGGKFLTPRPWGDYVHWKQPVKLWFMPASNASASLKVEAVYAAGDTTIHTTSVALNTDYLYELNCHPSRLGLPQISTAGNTMQFFDVWLESGGSNVSDKRRFTIDQEYCEAPYFMLFANSLGGIDDVYFSGRRKTGFDTSGQTAARPPRADDTIFEATVEVSDKTGHNTFTLNTGWKSTTSLEHMRDLLVAKQVWFLYEELASLKKAHIMPVVISAGENMLFDRQEDLFSMDITFREAHESAFSFDNRIF